MYKTKPNLKTHGRCFFFLSRYFEKLVHVMIDIDPNTASQPQLQATMKALPGVLEVSRGYGNYVIFCFRIVAGQNN